MRQQNLPDRRPVLRNVFWLAALLLLLMASAGCSFPSTPKKPSAQQKPAKNKTVLELLGGASPPTPTSIGGPNVTPVPLPKGCGEVESQAMQPAFGPDIYKMADAPCYDIEVTLHAPFQSLSGTELVYFTNREDAPLKTLYFRLYPQAKTVYGGQMTVSKAKVNKIEVLPEVAIEEDQSGVRIPLTEPLAPGRHLIIELEFEATIPTDFGGDAETSTSYGIFNYSDHDKILTLANWYPILAMHDKDGWHLDPVSGEGDAVFSETALYHVFLTTDLGMSIVNTGQQIHKQATPWGDVYFEMVSGPTRDFVIVLSPDLKAARQEENGILVNSYYLRPDSDAATQALGFATDALNTYQDLFGPYPYRELDLVGVPLRRAAGVEYPGVFLISRDLYKNKEDPFLEFAVAHETAHQWWYGVVGNDVVNHPWLDEALANYSAALYLEKAHGSAGLQQTLDNWNQILQKWQNDHTDEPIDQPLSKFQGRERAYSTIVYVKGALFFQALRDKIGDAAFIEALRQYYQAHRYGIARPTDLLSAFEAASGQDLSTLYHKWGLE